MFEGAPRPLITILAIMVALRLLFALLSPGVIVLSLLQVAFFVFMGWKALKGKRSAAILVGAGFALNGIGAVYEAIKNSQNLSTAALIVSGAFGLFFLGSAAYIFFNSRVKKFYTDRAFSF